MRQRPQPSTDEPRRFSPVFFQWLAINREAVATLTNSRFFGVEGGEALFFPRAASGPLVGGVPAGGATSVASRFFLGLVVIAAPLGGGLFVDNYVWKM